MSYGDQIIISKVHSQNDKAPDLRAEITIDGKVYEAGLWVWKRKDGTLVTDKQGSKKYMGKVKPKEERGGSEQSSGPEPYDPGDFGGDDIPF